MSINIQQCTIVQCLDLNVSKTQGAGLGQELKYLRVHISNKCGWQKKALCVISMGSQMLRFVKQNFLDYPQAVKEADYLYITDKATFGICQLCLGPMKYGNEV